MLQITLSEQRPTEPGLYLARRLDWPVFALYAMRVFVRDGVLVCGDPGGAASPVGDSHPLLQWSERVEIG